MRIRLILMTALLAACFVQNGVASPGRLKFEDFFVQQKTASKHARVQISDAQSRQYASQLREAAVLPENFGGHFRFATWGCGASCVMAAAIDLTTGRVAWLPFTVCCWPLDIQAPFEFRRNSQLLVVHGSRNETGSGTYYYQFSGQHFVLLKTE